MPDQVDVIEELNQVLIATSDTPVVVDETQYELTIQNTVNEVVVQDVPPDRVILASPIAINPGGGGSGSGATLGNPLSSILLAANIPAGGSQELDADFITDLMLGRLWCIDIGSSVPVRCDVQSVVGGTRTNYTSLYDEHTYYTVDPRFFKLEGDGGSGFGVTVYNLDPIDTADIRVTIFWDEVET